MNPAFIAVLTVAAVYDRRYNLSGVIERRCRLESTLRRLVVRWCRLPSFFFGAFLQRSFAGKFYPAFVVNADALHPNRVARFNDIFGSVHPKIRQFGNMDEPFLARQNFDESAELFRGNNATLK